MAEGKWRNCFNYAETRVVRVHSCWLFWIYWIAITGVVLGILVFIVCSRGWQEQDSVEGAVTTKLHGLTFNQRIWDNADYMIPPKENGAFTVITSLLQTRQRQSTCPEDPSIPDGRCTQNSDCIKDQPVFRGNGFKTGRCVNFAPGDNRTVCEIKAWCPVEIDDPSKRYAIADENFVVEIKNFVRFPKFQKDGQNFPDDMSKEELDKCTYDKDHDRNKKCPVFRVRTIVEEAGYTMDSMVMEGGTIQMVIKWECTFGCTKRFYKKECFPTYRFERRDVSKDNFIRGFHLRYADQYLGSDGLTWRTLYRAYGIRVIVTVTGTGWRFSLSASIFKFGSCLSYLGGVTLFMKVLLWCHRSCGCCMPCWEESDMDHKPTNPDTTDESCCGKMVKTFTKALRWCHRKCNCCNQCWKESDMDHQPTNPDTTVENGTRDRQVRRTIDDAIAIDFFTRNSCQDFGGHKQRLVQKRCSRTCCNLCFSWCCCRCCKKCQQAEETPQAASPPQTGHSNPAMSSESTDEHPAGHSTETPQPHVPNDEVNYVNEATQPTTRGDDGEVEQSVSADTATTDMIMTPKTRNIADPIKITNPMNIAVTMNTTTI